MKDLNSQVGFLDLVHKPAQRYEKLCITITDGDATSARTLPQFAQLCGKIDNYNTKIFDLSKSDLIDALIMKGCKKLTCKYYDNRACIMREKTFDIQDSRFKENPMNRNHGYSVKAAELLRVANQWLEKNGGTQDGGAVRSYSDDMKVVTGQASCL